MGTAPLVMGTLDGVVSMVSLQVKSRAVTSRVHIQHLGEGTMTKRDSKATPAAAGVPREVLKLTSDRHEQVRVRLW